MSTSTFVVGRVMAPRYPLPKLQTLWVGYLTWRQGLCSPGWACRLGNGKLPWSSRWPDVITAVLKRGTFASWVRKRDDSRRRVRDRMWEGLSHHCWPFRKLEEGATSQGRGPTLEAAKGNAKYCSLEPEKGTEPCWRCDVSPVGAAADTCTNVRW